MSCYGYTNYIGLDLDFKSGYVVSIVWIRLIGKIIIFKGLLLGLRILVIVHGLGLVHGRICDLSLDLILALWLLLIRLLLGHRFRLSLLKLLRLEDLNWGLVKTLNRKFILWWRPILVKSFYHCFELSRRLVYVIGVDFGQFGALFMGCGNFAFLFLFCHLKLSRNYVLNDFGIVADGLVHRDLERVLLFFAILLLKVHGRLHSRNLPFDAVRGLRVCNLVLDLVQARQLLHVWQVVFQFRKSWVEGVKLRLQVLERFRDFTNLIGIQICDLRFYYAEKG